MGFYYIIILLLFTNLIFIFRKKLIINFFNRNSMFYIFLYTLLEDKFRKCILYRRIYRNLMLGYKFLEDKINLRASIYQYNLFIKRKNSFTSVCTYLLSSSTDSSYFLYYKYYDVYRNNCFFYILN